MNPSCNVVIVGRPNVGKSTLFNRLIGRRRALVHDEPGVTRDRMEEKADWWVKGKLFPVTLVDTGGLGGERFSDQIFAQVQIALKHADVILFLFDSQVGLTSLDEELLLELKRSGAMKKSPLIGVVNKVDAESHEERIADFFSMGLDQVLTVSAEHGRGMDDLQEAVARTVGFDLEPVAPEEEAFPEEDEDFDEESTDVESSDREDDADYEDQESPEESEYHGPARIPKIAIIGRPNVGKSTLINAIIGEDRMITSPIAGTTIDAVDSLVELGGKTFLFMDTAGIRRKSKTEQGVEVLSVVQTRKALEKADVALLVLDGEVGTSDQDEKIGGLIEEAGCGLILVLNKWDTQEKNVKFTKELAAERIRAKMAYLRYAPIIFTSALHGDGIDQLGDLIEEIMKQRRLKISTREFTDWIRAKIAIQNPNNAKFYLCHQTGRNPPTFVCHVSDPDKVHFSLRRHLINGLRERWGFMGSPVRMLFVEGQAGRGRKTMPRLAKSNYSNYRRLRGVVQPRK